MGRCSVFKCKSDSKRKISDISFHSFIRKKWIETIGRTNWTPKKSFKICSKHFAQNMLFKKKKMTFLLPNAVPLLALVAARYGIMAGMLMSTFDILMYSHVTNFVPMLKRYACHTIPLGLMGATFALVSNGLLRLRETDDRLNYIAGGFACGPILAAYVGSAHGLVAGGIVMGIAAMIKKDVVDIGGAFFPDIPCVDRAHARQWRNDYSLVADPRDELLHTCGKDS